MAIFKVKTKGNSDPHGKSRVYFTCHPADFDKYFDKICEDVFSTHDCAIYYTQDMSAPHDADNLSVDLGQANIFLVPVTFKLLNEPNRTMQVDIPYAKENNIFILPFSMESGIDAIYSQPKNFGDRQYLSPFSSDFTEIAYSEKLEKILNAVLISDELAKRVRDAFAVYVFLSYRKKDRKYANDLMRIIHSLPNCKDIAIWYDEFLTPGESFTENIEKALKKSKLFTLLVTPNLLENENFVMQKEYPMARSANIQILPAEMELTDHEELKIKYEDIPECIHPYDKDFSEIFINTISRIAKTEDNDSPEHNFLIGLAYLDGIDVEIDVKRGIKLITDAAEKQLPEAMQKLYDMYYEGYKVQINYQEALKWAKNLADFYVRTYGERHRKTLDHLHDLGYTYLILGEYKKALQIINNVYELSKELFGKDDLDTLIALANLANIYEKIGEPEKALNIETDIYTTMLRNYGEDDANTLIASSNLASTYQMIGNYDESLKLQLKAYEIRKRVMGEDHTDTLISCLNLAGIYRNLGKYKKALEFNENAYALMSKKLGDTHPNTLSALDSLACTWTSLGEYKKSLSLHKSVYEQRSRVLGKEHPDTIESLHNLAFDYCALNQPNKALSLQKDAYELRCKLFGADNPTTLISLGNLAYMYGMVGNIKKELDLNRKLYELTLRNNGEYHEDTLGALNNLASSYSKCGKTQDALAIMEKLYKIMKAKLGASHPNTLTCLHNLAISHGDVGNNKQMLELMEEAYNSRCRVLGKEHPDTQQSLYSLSFAYGKMGDHKKAFELYSKKI